MYGLIDLANTHSTIIQGEISYVSTFMQSKTYLISFTIINSKHIDY